MDATLKELQQVIFNVVATRYTSAASITIICYDSLLVMPMEVKYVWSRKQSLASVLYCVNKYVSIGSLLLVIVGISGFVPNITDKQCGIVILLTACTQPIIGVAGAWLLTLRVLALLGNVRYVSVVLYTLLAAVYTIQQSLFIVSFNKTFQNARYEQLVGVCGIPDIVKTPTFRYVYLPPIFYETVITGITLWKTISYARLKGNSPSIILNVGRDGVIYFVAIVGLRITNSIIWIALPESLMNLLLYLQWSLVSVLISRFFLSLRESTTQNQSIDGLTIAFGDHRTQEALATRTFGGHTLPLRNLQVPRSSGLIVIDIPGEMEDTV